MKKSVILENIWKIYWRDGIFLDSKEFIFNKLILKWEFNWSLCENISENKFLKYEITFFWVLECKIVELDFFEKFYSKEEYISSFEEIIDSERVNFWDKKLRHFLFYTYDYVFEIICEKFETKT